MGERGDERFETRRILDPQTHQIHIVKAKPRPPPPAAAGKKVPRTPVSKAPAGFPPAARSRQERSQHQEISGFKDTMNAGDRGGGSTSSSRRTSGSRKKNARSTKMPTGEGRSDRLSTTSSEPSPDVPVSPRTVSLMLSQIGSTRIG